MFDIKELQVLRSSLDVIDIKGSNAKYLSILQIKIENKILKLQKEIKEGPPKLNKNK